MKVRVDPGICGFHCKIEAVKQEKYRVKLSIESECKLIRHLADEVVEMDMRDVVGKPHGTSVLVQNAGRCRLHAACPIPMACIKAVEAELGLALPRPVRIDFEEEDGQS